MSFIRWSVDSLPKWARIAAPVTVAVVTLAGCGEATTQKSKGSVKPEASATLAPSTTTTEAPTTTSTQAPTTTTTEAPAASGPVFANCTAAKAAGYHDIHRGEPGYSTKLDRDGDGVACES